MVFRMAGMRIMYIYLLLESLATMACARDMKIQRKSNGDLIYDINQEECTNWRGKMNNKVCFCTNGATFYSDITGYGCFEGTGDAIGCTLSIASSKNVPSFYQKDKNQPSFQFTFSGKNCNLTAMQEWNNGGWKPRDDLILKATETYVKISWRDSKRYNEDVGGRLFKISGHCTIDRTQYKRCLLVKSHGNKTYAFPVTKPPTASPTSTAIATNGRSGEEEGTSNQLTVALGVTCAVLIIIILTLFIIWYARRDSSKEEVNNFMNKVFRRKKNRNSNKQFENIYEDIGFGIMSSRGSAASSSEEKELYLAPVEVHNHYNSGFNEESGYREAIHIGDFYEAPIEESSNGVVKADTYEMPVTEPPTNSDDVYETPNESHPSLPDIYETPCDGNTMHRVSTSGYEGLLSDRRVNNSTREPYCRLSVQQTLPTSERYKNPTNNMSIDRNEFNRTSKKEDLYEEALSHHTPPTSEPFYFETRGSPR